MKITVLTVGKIKEKYLKEAIAEYSKRRYYVPERDFAEVEAEFAGKGYGDFKMAVGEAVVSVLKPLQDEVARLEKDKAYIDGIIKNNAEIINAFDS